MTDKEDTRLDFGMLGKELCQIDLAAADYRSPHNNDEVLDSCDLGSNLLSP